MTINTESTKRTYAGNGTATAFDYDFKIFVDADLRVSLVDDATGAEVVQVLNTDYTVTGEGFEAGGKVTFVTPPPTGQTVLILSDVPYTQATDLKNQGRFFPETIENAFDRTTRQALQLKEVTGRSLTLPAQVAGVSTELPVPEVSKLIGWDTTGAALRNYSVGEIGTTLAFSNFHADVFTATVGQTDFTLTDDPGVIANLDVSIDGVTQVPTVDYTLTGTTLSFVTPMAGGEEVLARYGTALPVGVADASAVLFTQSGTGAVARTVLQKVRERVTLEDYGAVGDGVADDTAAIAAALAANKMVRGTPNRAYRCTSGFSIVGENSVLDLCGATIVADYTPASAAWFVTVGDGVANTARTGIINGRIITANVSTNLNGVRFRKNVRRNTKGKELRIGGFKGTGVYFEELNWSVQGGLDMLVEGCGTNLVIEENGNAITLVGMCLDGAAGYNCEIRGCVGVTFVGGYNQFATQGGILIDNGKNGQPSSGITLVGHYMEGNGINHIVARNGKGLTVYGSPINCAGMTGSAIKLENWVGAQIEMNAPANLSTGTSRDFVETNAACSLISVGEQAVSTLSDIAVNVNSAGAMNGIIRVPATAKGLPTPSVLNRGGTPILVFGTGTDANRSLPYLCVDVDSGTRAYRRMALAPRKQAAVLATSPYTPNVSSVEVFDLTVPGAGLTINAPTGQYADGDEVTFLLKQTGAGAGAVTFNAIYATDYSDTGNTANTYASVTFRWSAGRSRWIQTAKLGWSA